MNWYTIGTRQQDLAHSRVKRIEILRVEAALRNRFFDVVFRQHSHTIQLQETVQGRAGEEAQMRMIENAPLRIIELPGDQGRQRAKVSDIGRRDQHTSTRKQQLRQLPQYQSRRFKVLQHVG